MRKKNKSSRPHYGVIIWMILIIAATYLAVPTVAAPPSPELLERLQNAGSSSSLVAQLPSSADLHNRDICTPDNFFSNYLNRRQVDAAAAPTAGGFKILALLVKFSDHNSAVAPAFFDSLLFDSSGSSTVKHYFNEISNTQIDLVTVNLPSSLGWNTAPQTYAYYVNGQNGTGAYPHNSQKLVEDLVDVVNPSVNFANYDNDGNGFVDCLLVIHSGTGAEVSSSPNDIWSHKWGISPKLVDGVRVSTFTIQPEFWNSPGDMTIGVYSHELCHGFGLPDLYDTNTGNGNSTGAGKWCIMAYGCWNGSPGKQGNSPAHPCAWSRIHMGLAAASVVSSNITARTIQPVETGGTIYRLWTSGAGGNEHFLVENRQKTGYDTWLPASGLLIWHIDDGKNDNASAWYPGLDSTQHYLVALEQADGLYHLEHASNYGDGADPFPGTGNKVTFSTATTPNSNSYLSGSTPVAVTNISTSGSNIIADLIVGLAADVDDDGDVLPTTFTLLQNYPNPFNPTTVLSFEFSALANVRLEIFNTLGQKVKLLYTGQAGVGLTQLFWDGSDDRGEPVSSGVYFYRLVSADGFESSKKMVLVR